MFFVFLAGWNSGCGSSQDPAAPEGLRLHWEVAGNFLEDHQSLHELSLINESDKVLENNWAVYFNSLRLLDTASVPPVVLLTHVNGDFYRMEPGPEYEWLQPGDALTFRYLARGPAIMEIDGPDGAYLDFAGITIQHLPVTRGVFEREEQWHRSVDDAVPLATAGELYLQYTPVFRLHPDRVLPVVPTPVSFKRIPGKLMLTSRSEIRYEPGLESEADFLARSLEPLLGVRLKASLNFAGPDSGRVEEPDSRQSVSERVGNGVSGLVTSGENEGSIEASDTLLFPGIPDAEAVNSSIILLQSGSTTEEEVLDVREDPLLNGDEAYFLVISDSAMVITGNSSAGVFYGIQTFRSLLPPEAWKQEQSQIEVPRVEVRDAPGFSYRGLHIDVSRNFQPVETIKKMMDLMAFYKLNRLHFHLTDDEGWRLDIASFPELTEIGGRRGHTLEENRHLMPSYGSGPHADPDVSMGSGWYTREEFIDLLRYASERHIQVIPEIDVPGHARAALVAMKNRYRRLMQEGRIEEAARYRIHDPEDTSVYRSIQQWDDNVINVCQESTYRFLRVIYDEMIDMYREAGSPLHTIHIGGDEVPSGVWVDSPVCRELIDSDDRLESTEDLMEYFFMRSRQDLADRGLVMSAWEEFSLITDPETGEVAPNPQFAGKSVSYVWSNIWGTGTESYSYALANAGYEIVMSHASNLYFDLSYHKHPEESGLYWAGFVDTPDPYAFMPYRVYESGILDVMGKPIPGQAYEGKPELTDEGRKRILGLQAQLWGETFRTPGRIEYMALPRLVAMAERAWVPEAGWMDGEAREIRQAGLAEAWNEFSNRLGQRELPRLDAMNGGYAYRIPPPGAVVRDGMFYANTAHPGMEIRYTTDGREPDVDAPLYRDPVRIRGNPVIRVRTFDTRGRGSRTVTVGGR